MRASNTTMLTSYHINANQFICTGNRYYANRLKESDTTKTFDYKLFSSTDFSSDCDSAHFAKFVLLIW